MFFLAGQGYRAIAHDRRGRGRSSQPWEGNDMDTCADDLDELVEHLDLKNAMVVGHSTGGGEVVRYLARPGSSRVSKAVLVAAVPPLVVETDKSPHGVPKEVSDGFRTNILANRSKFFFDAPSGPFFSYNRPEANVSQTRIWSWWRRGMACGFRAVYDCVKAFSETDFTDDLKGLNVPVLVLHGDDDQVVPIEASEKRSAELVQPGMLKVLKVLKVAPHTLPANCAEEVNDSLLEFLTS